MLHTHACAGIHRHQFRTLVVSVDLGLNAIICFDFRTRIVCIQRAALTCARALDYTADTQTALSLQIPPGHENMRPYTSKEKQ